MTGRVLHAAGLFLPIATAYAYTGWWLYVRWTAPESLYAHGLLVPLVSLWLVYRRRDRLRALPPAPAWSGLALILPALGLHLAAVYTEVYSPSAFTLPVLFAGMVVYFRGWKALRPCLFPLAYLYFALPLPMNWVAEMSFHMKMAAVRMAVGAAGFLGASVEVRGAQILLREGGTLPVAAPCSGLRSAVALLALAVLYGVVFAPLNLLGRSVFILLSLPLAVASNVLRIAFLCLVADRFGPAAAGGWVHDLSGLGIYLAAFLLMLAAARLLTACPCFRRKEAP